MKLDRSELLLAYRAMKVIREFEERIHVEFATGEIPGFVHLYAGEEAIATGFYHLPSCVTALLRRYCTLARARSTALCLSSKALSRASRSTVSSTSFAALIP
jgi:hypothetical protein